MNTLTVSPDRALFRRDLAALPLAAQPLHTRHANTLLAERDRRARALTTRVEQIGLVNPA